MYGHDEAGTRQLSSGSLSFCDVGRKTGKWRVHGLLFNVVLHNIYTTQLLALILSGMKTFATAIFTFKCVYFSVSPCNN